MQEDELIRKLKLIEALHVGAATAGERDAAFNAMDRIRERLESYRKLNQKEFTFTFQDQWQRKLFVALLRRYGIRPYRYPRQRYTTVMFKVPQRFLAETLEPELRQMLAALSEHMNDVTDRILKEAIHADRSEAEVIPEPQSIGAGP